MSEIHIEFAVQFSEQNDKQQFIKYLEQNSTERKENLSTPDKSELTLEFIQGANISIDYLNEKDGVMLGKLTTGTISFDTNKFQQTLLSDRICCSVVSYFFDQSGEFSNFSTINGKKAGINKAYAMLAETSPSIALALAVTKGKIKLVREYLEKGADPNAYYRNSPLICWAANWERPAILQELLKAGADINARNFSKNLARGHTGETPLHIATLADNLEVVKVLCEAGADVNSRDKLGETPLYECLPYPSSRKVSEVLLEYGADINSVDHEGKTVLMACGNTLNNASIVNWLIKMDIDYSLKCNSGGNLLWYVYKDSLMGRRMVRSGKDEFCVPNNAYVANNVYDLKKASIHGDKAGWKTFFEEYRDKLSQEDMAILMGFAIQNNNQKQLQILVENGFDITKVSKKLNPIDTARHHKNYQAVTFLEERFKSVIEKEANDKEAVRKQFESFMEIAMSMAREQADESLAFKFLTKDLIAKNFNWQNVITIIAIGFKKKGQIKRIEMKHDGQDKIEVLGVQHHKGMVFRRFENNWLIESFIY